MENVAQNLALATRAVIPKPMLRVLRAFQSTELFICSCKHRTILKRECQYVLAVGSLWFDESRESHYSDITVSVIRLQDLRQKSDMTIACCTLLGVYSGLLLTFLNSTHLLVHDITPHGILHTSDHVIA